MSMSIRPRRSVLFMPGSNARAIEKAKTLPVDGVILDLEDAVAPNAKESARKQAHDAIKAGGFGKRETFIRTNGIDTPWFADDLNAAVHAGPDAILVPKIGTPQQLELIGQRLLDMHANTHVQVWAMIETSTAIFNVQALAAAARDSETRLAGFVMGTNDLAKETRARIVPGRAPMLSWLSSCVLAAHAYGIEILDSVYNDISDADGFARECVQGRDLGFDGKTLIHPSQIEACNAAFSPSADELAQARKIIAAFARPENKGKGVIELDGRMVERMHADMAQRTVAIADAIEARRQL
jgi:citrate lyase subunit beta/citryl-CoA lyase